jgi:mono/diheme cytochrome c family protein
MHDIRRSAVGRSGRPIGRNLAILALIVLVLGFATFWLITTPETVAARALPSYRPDVANGRVIFYAGGCAACHATPQQDDLSRLGGGRGLKTPFGTFYAPNISPDPHDGIGAWSEADFVTAMWKGTSPDGRHYFPAFPYDSFDKVKLEDVRDLFAYLKTLPPVSGRAPDHDVRFPFSMRRLVGVWKFLFLDDAPIRTDPSKSAAWNRGAYLVNGPGHCAECHSPRNMLGGLVADQRFAGGPDAEGEGWVPNITQKELASWSEKDIAYLLETGDTPDGDSVGGSMTAVVKNTAQLSADDRAAIAAYVKSLPPVEGPKPPPKKN